jgi:hypothetical protein
MDPAAREHRAPCHGLTRERPGSPTRRRSSRRSATRLDPETLRRAQTILCTATERETVEVALDMIAFRQELLAGTRVLSDLQIDPIR